MAAPAYRYDARLANEIERRWQQRWADEGTFDVPNPVGELSAGFDRVAGRPALYVLDMFPYPSGAGLHVGHPLGYIGTDVFARYMRMRGHQVLHPFGYDSFGLPAEQYAIETGQHPRVTTERNIDNMRRQLRRLGLGHDRRRELATSDVGFYRWTQWIFLQIFNAWFDPVQRRARPIAELDIGDRELVDARRLAYIDLAPVNWCPGLGTVLANEEITADGRSEVGNFPVHRRLMRQWKIRITAYAERLLEDLEEVDWPAPIQRMQRNWIGRSDGARIRFGEIEVFTTRPDTVFGATFLVLAPEHRLVDALTTPDRAAEVAAYREATARRSDRERLTDTAPKTGTFTGACAVNPATGEPIPIFIADYVLTDYGTGAIMGVPAHDERDLAFARRRDLPLHGTVEPPADWSAAGATRWLQARGAGEPAVSYRLRDWLFSRQRYWGEPFPIVYDADGLPVALPEDQLPVELPRMRDFGPPPGHEDDDSEPAPPLARARDWATVTLDLGDGPREYRRELNTMPQWAGSCWYYLRYLDPANDRAFVDPGIERYWMGRGGVDLYVGGVEHAVLHLLYARLWHKILFDLGHVSTPEPFHRLFNQGYILAAAFTDSRGTYVPADEVTESAGGFSWRDREVTREYGKMGKSLKNGVSPDEIYERYGADTLRLYEMSMAPLDLDRAWDTSQISGVFRFLQRLWRNVVDEASGEATVTVAAVPEETQRQLHQAIARTAEALEGLRFNTAIAALIELNNHLTAQRMERGPLPRGVAEPLVLMVAPLAPHVAEELWARLGHAESLTDEPFPRADPALLAADEVVVPVQVNGKVRFQLALPADAEAEAMRTAVLADPRLPRYLEGREVVRVVPVPGRIVSVVLSR